MEATTIEKVDMDAVATELKDKAVAVFDDKAVESHVCDLYSRWLDEREYEDFADYQKHMKKGLESRGVDCLKVTKRPFGFEFKVRHVDRPSPSTSRGFYAIYRISVTSRKYKMTRVKVGYGPGRDGFFK